MDYLYDPFHRRHYRNPSPFFSSAAGAPLQRAHPAVVQPDVPRRRGVVSIPVVDGNRACNPQPVKMPGAKAPTKLSEHGAAVRIQRAFRGHLVRKAVAAVRALDAEVGVIEARVRESLGRITTDERERVRVGEMLMRVLLRLDGIRGARAYRKKVVRRAVKLQEMIDSLVAGGAGEEVSSGEDEAVEERRNGEVAVQEEDVAMGKNSISSDEGCSFLSDYDSGRSFETGAEAIEEAGSVEKVEDIQNNPRPVDEVTQAEKSVIKLDSMEEIPAISGVTDNHTIEDESSVTKPDAMEKTPVAHVRDDRVDDAMEDASAAKVRSEINEQSAATESSVENASEQEDQKITGGILVDNADLSLRDESTAPPDEGSPEPDRLESIQSALPCSTLAQTHVRAPDPMETAVGHMAQENQLLRGMVEELLQQSALQCRLVCQLTRRVESLEKKVEKMGKKKRKHAGDAAAAATGKKS